MSVERALNRPLDHEDQSPEARWSTDRRLAILDWNPSPEEAKEYALRRAERVCQKLVEKKG